MNLKDQVVLVTGGARGIGFSIALACAKQGAKVTISSRSADELKKAAQEIREKTGSTILPVLCDVSKADQVKHLFRETYEKFGSIFGLICAAAIYGPIGPFDENSLDEWEEAIQINLIGTARCVYEAIPDMKEHRNGRIILFSGGGQGALPNFTSYVTSKGGILRFTETLGTELAPFGVYVNAIAPGAVNTRFLDNLLAADPNKVGLELYNKSQQQRQQGGHSPEKAADLSLYLLSDQAKGLYGKVLSAIWDRYREIQNPQDISKTDLYTNRRVVTEAGGTRAI